MIRCPRKGLDRHYVIVDVDSCRPGIPERVVVPVDTRAEVSLELDHLPFRNYHVLILPGRLWFARMIMDFDLDPKLREVKVHWTAVRLPLRPQCRNLLWLRLARAVPHTDSSTLFGW